MAEQAGYSFRIDFRCATTGDLLGRTCVSHSELLEKRGTLTRSIIGPNLTAVGDLTVSYLVITPFVHPGNTMENPIRPFPVGVPAGSTKFIGHRGYGSTNNLLIHKHRRKCVLLLVSLIRALLSYSCVDHHAYIRYGVVTENTLSSFLAAAKHGAQWVEFDVQLTKDNIPILVHDEDISTLEFMRN